MIDPKTFREIIAEALADVPEVKTRKIVITDDEFVDILNDIKTLDNLLFIGVLPSYSGFGKDEDDNGQLSYLQFFVLKKVDYKSFRNNDEYLAVMQETLDAIKKFLFALFGQSQICGADRLQYNWNIRPISRKSQCMGYELQIESESFAELL